MNFILNSVIIINVILAYTIREMWKDNKKHREIIKVLENALKLKQ